MIVVRGLYDSCHASVDLILHRRIVLVAPIIDIPDVDVEGGTCHIIGVEHFCGVSALLRVYLSREDCHNVV